MMKDNFYTYKYPRPAAATDAVVFGYDGNQMNILLIERGNEPFKGCWAIPGGFIRMDETAEQGAYRELAEETNVQDIYLEQFHTFSTVDRDPRERVLSIAFFALIRKSDCHVIAGDDAAKAKWFHLDNLPDLAFDHAEIISMAKEKLQEASHTQPIAFKLLDKKFTMQELQRLFEIIDETTFDRSAFQKEMLATGFIVEEKPCEESKNCEMQSLYSFNEKAFYEATAAKHKKAFPFVF